jgi:hypothetical protein
MMIELKTILKNFFFRLLLFFIFLVHYIYISLHILILYIGLVVVVSVYLGVLCVIIY